MIFKIWTLVIRVHPRSPEVTKVRRFPQTLMFFVKEIFFKRRFSYKKLLIRTHLNIFSKKILIFQKNPKILLRKLALEFFADICRNFALGIWKALLRALRKATYCVWGYVRSILISEKPVSQKQKSDFRSKF